MGWCPRSSPARRGRGESRRMRPTAGAAGRHPARHGGGKLRLKAEQVRRLFARSTLLRKRRYFSWSLVSAKSPMCTVSRYSYCKRTRVERLTTVQRHPVKRQNHTPVTDHTRDTQPRTTTVQHLSGAERQCIQLRASPPVAAPAPRPARPATPLCDRASPPQRAAELRGARRAAASGGRGAAGGA